MLRLYILSIVAGVASPMGSVSSQDPTSQSSTFNNWANRLFDSSIDSTTTKETTTPSTLTTIPTSSSSLSSLLLSTKSVAEPQPNLPTKMESAVRAEKFNELNGLENKPALDFSSWSNSLFASDTKTNVDQTPGTINPTPNRPISTTHHPLENNITNTTSKTITKSSAVAVVSLTNHSLRFQEAREEPTKEYNDTMSNQTIDDEKGKRAEEQKSKHSKKQEENIKLEEKERMEESKENVFRGEIDQALQSLLAEQRKQEQLRKEQQEKGKFETEKAMKMEEGKKTQEKMANETRTKNTERKKAAYEENQKRLEQAQKINFRKNTFEKYKKKFLKKYEEKGTKSKDMFEVDRIQNSILDSSLGIEGCSGIGRWSKESQQCLCPNGHGGEFCQYKLLNPNSHGKHGRFIGGSKCEHGRIIVKKTNGTKEECICDPGYYGFHCHFQSCENGGKRSCPNGKDTFCSRKVCLCKPGYLGEHCGNRDPNVIFVNGTAIMRSAGSVRSGVSLSNHSGIQDNTGLDSISMFSSSPKSSANCQKKLCPMNQMFDKKSCTCKCEEGRSGSDCSECTKSSSICNGGEGSLRALDLKTCSCQCPYTSDDDDFEKKQYQCKNGGIFDDIECKCKCKDGFVGPNCDECATRRSCHGHGIWSKQQCQCICRPPWLEKHDCEVCGTKDDLQCGKHGKFNSKTCGCTCNGGWTGLQCNSCKLKSCGLYEFDQKNCRCTNICKEDAAMCLHGSKMNKKTCKCDCNKNSNIDGSLLEEFFANRDIEQQRRLQNQQQQQRTRLRRGSSIQPKRGAPPSSYMQMLPAWIQLSTSFLTLGEKKTPTISGDRLDDVRDAIAHGTTGITFWSGDNCERCILPLPLPCIPGHAFDTTTCQCAATCSIDLECKNGGNLISKGCICSCPGGWTGNFCELKADGTTQKKAAYSCQAILETTPSSSSGVYWLVHPQLKTKGSPPFQVICDMDSDGGGWTSIASVGTELAKRSLTTMDYTRGINSANGGDGGEFITNCK